MNKDKMAIWAVMMTTPTAAFALESDPIVYSFIGGAAGGFLGALIACWICCRRKKDDAARKTY
jgi:hypothetical protein